MSLEQALSECTLAIKQLIVVMTTANEAEQPAGGDTEGGKRKRRTKAELEADAAAAAAATTTVKHELLAEGDPAGTRYFHIAAHNTIYRQLPGEPDCTMAGAIIVSGTEYTRLKAEYAAKFPTSAQGAQATAAAPTPAATTHAASAASSTPPDASAAPTMQSITAKLMAIHKRDGNAGLAPILAHFGVTKVPELASKDMAVLDAHVEGVLNPATGANLFG